MADIKTTVTVEFRTSDGHVYKDVNEAIAHEEWLAERKKERELWEYVDKNAIRILKDQYNGIGGYLGGSESNVYFLEVDDTVIEWARMLDEGDENLENYIGDKAFFRTPFDNAEVSFLGNIDQIIQQMEEDVLLLKDWRDKQ